MVKGQSSKQSGESQNNSSQAKSVQSGSFNLLDGLRHSNLKASNGISLDEIQVERDFLA